MTNLYRPEDLWPIEKDYADEYQSMVAQGRAVAKDLKACVVAIGRNAVPMVGNTLGLVEELQAGFAECRMHVFENDSTDVTAEYLDAFAASRPWFTVEHETLGGEDLRGFDRSRTERLAYCRNKCLQWVKENCDDTAWTIVLDLDPDHGFSVDGVFNSIAWLGRLTAQPALTTPGGMASYSLYMEEAEEGDGCEGGYRLAQYDSWAARLNWWEDRREKVGMGWFSLLLPPAGSRPIPMNSCFGGLCVYRTSAFLAGGYSGEDCEHVPHHKRMREAGYQMYLNPGCRYVAVIK